MSSSVQPVGSAGGPGDDPGSVDPAAKPVRRSFTAEYRARVVAEYAAAPHGEKSAVLRREGLYQLQIREWTDARDAIARGLPPRPNSHHRSGRKGRFVAGCGSVTRGERAVDPRTEWSLSCHRTEIVRVAYDPAAAALIDQAHQDEIPLLMRWDSIGPA